ncbi:hypothetical protein HK414_25085 [Ramlibacter terrae]|uniref:Uncharacterized protein n=1 Tax=Ramlibacter terrae TaxID=2732511 RepID=A0ABX6P7H7_9BURK|nr:hypothetical protein HK414_25085 [Ramlibacter terrae]
MKFQFGRFSAEETQLLDFSRLGGRSPPPVNKVIHTFLPLSQTPVESMTYPGFRVPGLKKLPKWQ